MAHAKRDYPFYRHGESASVSTPLDRYIEVRHWLSYMAAPDFVTDNLQGVHGVAKTDAKARTKKIIPHAHDAIAFLDMVDSSPVETGFVPGYYAILNLLKICILSSPLHSLLQSQRYHGARYEVDSKDSHSLLTDDITVMNGGAMAIYYKLLTGQSWGNNKRIKVGSLYEYLTDVSHEYSVATGKETRQANIEMGSVATSRMGRIRICLTTDSRDDRARLRPRDIPGLKGMIAHGAGGNHFHSSKTFDESMSTDDLLDSVYDRRFLYYPDSKRSRLPLAGLSILPVGEIPIILTFFHLSSVARYKPEFLYKITGSKCWPMVSAHLRQGLYKYILLFWSDINKRTFIVNSN